MEVQVYSGGNNVALQGTAKLSSQLSNFGAYNFVASTAIDGQTSNGHVFAHSKEENGARDVSQRCSLSPHLKLTDTFNRCIS